MSGDQDIFHDSSADIVAISKVDVANLQAAGFDVESELMYEGLVEASVMSETEGFSKIQWVEAGSYNFFQPVPDEDLGWRLHMADIATGKVLAAGGRHKVRDYVDLTLIHENIMPLWHAIWAAPGKDASWSPISLAEKIAKSNQFAQEEIDGEILSLTKLSAPAIGSTIREAIEEAISAFGQLPSETAGCLFVDEKGNIATSLNEVLATDSNYKPIKASRGGAWPSGLDIDHALISKIIEVYGTEGGKLTGEEPSGNKP